MDLARRLFEEMERLDPPIGNVTDDPLRGRTFPIGSANSTDA